MDNITHSLVGFAVADAVVQWRRSRDVETPEPQRRLFWIAAFLGANVSDLDVVASLLTDGRLGYLLHHRGHTHTFVGLIPQFLLLWLGMRWWSRRKGVTGASHQRWIVFLLAAGLFSHLFLDSLNFYGVHLFWPFDNRWFYGDSLFILEPWLWLGILPGLYLAEVGRFARAVFGVTFLVGAGLTLLTGHVPWLLAIAVVLYGVGLWRWIRRFAPGPRITLALLAMLLPLLVFTGLSQHVRSRFSARYAEAAVDGTLYDLALSPMPANPFCWYLLTVETYGQGKYYRIRSGMHSPFPWLISPERCPRMGLGEGTASLSETEPPATEDTIWFGQILNSVESLKGLAASNCVVAAFLRFSRVPYFQVAGKDILMGDLRFDRNRGLDFAEVQAFREPFKCPAFVPSWEPPLSDLLR